MICNLIKTKGKRYDNEAIINDELEPYQKHQSILSSEKGREDFHDNNGDFRSIHSSDSGCTKVSRKRSNQDIQEKMDVPLLSDVEKQELVTLVRDRNISMDFILEMKEAFLLFDKVR